MYAVVLYSIMQVGFCTAFEITQTVIDAGLTITQSGEWILAESVTVRGSVGITIQADDVVLNLNGNAMQGQGAADCGIVIEADNCSIRDGALEGFGVEAIQVYNASRAYIYNLSIFNSCSGIQIRNSSDVDVKKITIKDLGDTAISINNSSYISVAVCFIKDIGNKGIVISDDSSSVLLHTVYVDRCQATGLIIDARDVHLFSVSVQFGGADGIVINGNSVTCEGVISAFNKGSGIVMEGTNTLLRNCMASHNESDGIICKDGAQRAVIFAGRYAANGRIGINNQGAVDNTASYAQVYDNRQRNLYHIMNTAAIGS